MIDIAPKLLTTAHNTVALTEAIDSNRTTAIGSYVSVGDVSLFQHKVKVNLKSKNLFRVGTVDDYDGDDFGFVLSSESITQNSYKSGASDRHNIAIKYKPGYYTLSANVTENAYKRFVIRAYDAGGNLLTGTDVTITNGSGRVFSYNTSYKAWITVEDTSKGCTPILVPDTVAYWGLGFVFYYNSAYDDLNQNQTPVTYSNIQVELGTTATPYTPYIDNFADRKSKNLFNLQGREVVNFGAFANTTKRTFLGGKGIILGFARTNYCYSRLDDPHTITDNSVSYTCIDDYYGIGFDIKLLPNTTYVTSVSSRTGGIYLTEYDVEGNYIQVQGLLNSDNSAIAITTSPTTDWGVVSVLSAKGSTVGFTDLQLELGTTATPYTPYGDLPPAQLTVSGKNLFDISKVITESTEGGTGVTNNGDGTLTVKTYATGAHASKAPNKLKDYAPDLKAGETYFWSCYSTPVNGSSYANNYVYLSGTGANVSWFFNSSKVVTEEMLNAKVYWYTWGQIQAETTISNIQIERDTTATTYEPYKESTTHTANADGTVDNVFSISPSMSLTTNDSGAIVECGYFKTGSESVLHTGSKILHELKTLRSKFP